MNVSLTLRLLLLVCAAQAAARLDCPKRAIEGFDERGNRLCFLFERFAAQFVIAESLCRASNGTLASIGSQLVNNFLARIFKSLFLLLLICILLAYRKWCGGVRRSSRARVLDWREHVSIRRLLELDEWRAALVFALVDERQNGEQLGGAELQRNRNRRRQLASSRLL